MNNHPFFTTHINQYDEAIKSMAPTIINGENVILSQEQQRSIRDTLNTSIVKNPFAYQQYPQVLCAQKQFIPGGVLFTFQSPECQQFVNPRLESCTCNYKYEQFQLPDANAQFNVQQQQQVKFHHDQSTFCHIPIAYYEDKITQINEECICIGRKCAGLESCTYNNKYEQFHLPDANAHFNGEQQQQVKFHHDQNIFCHIPVTHYDENIQINEECICIVQKCAVVDEIMPAKMITSWTQTSISETDSANDEKPKKKRRNRTDSRDNESRTRKKLKDSSSQTTVPSEGKDADSEKEQDKLENKGSETNSKQEEKNKFKDTTSSESEPVISQQKQEDSKKRRKNKQKHDKKLKKDSSQHKIEEKEQKDLSSENKKNQKRSSSQTTVSSESRDSVISQKEQDDLKKRRKNKQRYAKRLKKDSTQHKEKEQKDSSSENIKNQEQNPLQTTVSSDNKAFEKSKDKNRNIELKDCESQTDTSEPPDETSHYCECKVKEKEQKYLSSENKKKQERNPSQTMTVSSESRDSVISQEPEDLKKRRKNKQKYAKRLKKDSTQHEVKEKEQKDLTSKNQKNQERNPSQMIVSSDNEAYEKTKDKNRNIELKDCESQTETSEPPDETSHYYESIPTLVLLLWSFADSAKVISTSSCKCWQDYQAEIGESGLQCVALDQFHVMPCNMPKLPKCECSDGVSSILKDESGTWCTKYTKGEELMRWPCENVREWDEFFRKNPNLL